MAQRVNRHVLQGLPGLFGSEKHPDCVILFCLEANPADTEDKPSKRMRLGNGSTAPSPPNLLGAPLPAHRWVLGVASDRFAAQLESWTDSDATSGRLELPIPLRSEEEVPGARAAIEYAYTGEIKPASVREVLEMRHQAQYLQIKDCAADCDLALGRILEPGSSQQQQQQPVLELYGCKALWPDSEAELTFAAILERAAALLVAHFCDALKTLNSPSLLEQLLALPAVGLEVLLGSNDFGTDDESSVLMLLASWMKVNWSRTDEKARRRLCRTVRLAQVNLPYRSMIVPALAADYQSNPGHPAGWFPIGVTRASFATSLAGFTPQQQLQLLDATKDDPWVSGSGRLLELSPRPQCIPPDGLSYSWHIDKEDLLEGVQQLQPECEPLGLCASFNNSDCKEAVARGFALALTVWFKWGQPAAGLDLVCELPATYQVPGSQLGSGNRNTTIVPVDARVTVHRSQRDVVTVWDSSRHTIMVGASFGFPEALPLLPQPAASEGGSGGSSTVGGGGGGDPLAAWAEYLKDGMLTGTLTLMRPAVKHGRPRSRSGASTISSA